MQRQVLMNKPKDHATRVVAMQKDILILNILHDVTDVFPLQTPFQADECTGTYPPSDREVTGTRPLPQCRIKTLEK